MRPSDPQTVSVLPRRRAVEFISPSSLRSFPTFPFNELNVYPLRSFRVSFNASVATNKKFVALSVCLKGRRICPVTDMTIQLHRAG